MSDPYENFLRRAPLPQSPPPEQMLYAAGLAAGRRQMRGRFLATTATLSCLLLASLSLHFSGGRESPPLLAQRSGDESVSHISVTDRADSDATVSTAQTSDAAKPWPGADPLAWPMERGPLLIGMRSSPAADAPAPPSTRPPLTIRSWRQSQPELF